MNFFFFLCLLTAFILTGSFIFQSRRKPRLFLSVLVISVLIIIVFGLFGRSYKEFDAITLVFLFVLLIPLFLLVGATRHKQKR